MRRGRLILLIALVTLAVPATAEAFWQYRGHVRDPKRTAIQLVVRHTGGRPKAVVHIATGRVPLRCSRGSQSRVFEFPFTFRLARKQAFSVHFGVVGATVSPGGGVHRRTSFKASMRGAIHRRRAAGFLRLRTNDRGPKGKCDSGLLRWHARFVPRSR